MEYADSSKPKVPSCTTNPTQHHHALSPAARPTIQPESMERSQSSELKQSGWNYQAEAVSPRYVTTSRYQQVRFLTEIVG
jgi:hypothetical protein